MIEIQCTSCNTRYRIDERVLPDDTPTFKCSRCGHVFSAEGIAHKARKPAAAAAKPEPSAAPAPTSASETATAPEPDAEPQPEPPPPGLSAAIAADPHAAPDPKPPAPEPELRGGDPLDRTFGDREPKADTGESLRFDFSAEGKHIDGDAPEIAAGAHRDEGWEVGEVPPEIDETEPPVTMRAAPPVRDFMHPNFAPVAERRPPDAQPARAPTPSIRGAGSEGLAQIAAPGKMHSSGYFLAAFFAVATGFLGASILICSEPAASARALGQAPAIGPYFAPPIVPAMLVALHDVKSGYRKIKGGHAGLVITGSAENLGDHPLHLVQIGVDLLDHAGRTVARQGVYCGNELSAKMLREMTPRELEFSQALSPHERFTIEPSAAAPFLMVFINPPRRVASLRISVTRAAAADAPPAGSGQAPHA